MEAKNVDDVLVASMNNISSPAVEISEPKNDPVHNEEPKEAAIDADKPIEAIKIDNTIDEYGNPVEKPKVYTEEEVNRLIRDRLSRVKADQVQPVVQKQQIQQSQEQEENWEEQLETFVDKTIEKREQKLADQQWKQRELAKQSEFEDKFSQGMNKYSDFRDIIAGKNITDSMMLATRSLDNPAAFIYGASKFHAQDLDRISNISDPYAQAAEMGRLHEKMIKSKHAVSNAPKPLEAISGDVPSQNFSNMPSLEDRIQQYAKQKRK